MSKPTITNASGQPVFYLEPDAKAPSERVFEVPGIDIYQARPATAQDLAQAILTEPCNHRVGFAMYPHMEVGLRSRHLVVWSQFRSHFSAADGHGPAARALIRVKKPMDNFWECYICGVRVLLTEFDIPQRLYARA